MVPDSVQRTVGLITIECLPGGRSQSCSGCEALDDSTLGQLLIHLAAHGVGLPVGPSPDEASPPRTGEIGPRLPAGRFARQAPRLWQPSTRLSADLASLAAELERALARARRRIAAAAAPAGAKAPTP